MSTQYLTNDYLNNIILITDEEIITQKDNNAVFMQFLENDNKLLGCVFTLKRKKTYQCKLCRRLFDKERYKRRKLSKPSSADNPSIDESSLESWDSLPPQGIELQTNNSPATVQVEGENIIKWIKRDHLSNCTLQTIGIAIAKSHKNLAVIHKSQVACSSKQAYDTYSRYLSRDKSDLVTKSDRVEGYPPFHLVKSTFDKACKYM